MGFPLQGGGELEIASDEMDSNGLRSIKMDEIDRTMVNSKQQASLELLN